MAIDITELVKVHIRPALALDNTIEDDLSIYIVSKKAEQGWSDVTLTDAQSNYVAALVLEALMFRFSQVYMDDVQELGEGPERVRLPSRSEFFKTLRQVIKDLKAGAARGAGLLDDESAKNPNSWPGCGLVAWGDRT